MSLTRQDQILKLIVEEFISTAQPVGSKTLIEKYNLDCSSATIRNDMMGLENEGLIEKTHASSGRVPSAKGYRYYVSHLKESQDLTVDSQFKKEFQMILAKKSQSVEDVMDKSCEILSEMTNMATVVLGNDAHTERLISVSVVPLNDHAATAIFVTDRGYVSNKTFVIKSEQDGKNIIKCVEMLNQRLTGTLVEELTDKLNSLKPILNEILGKSSDVIMESFLEAFIKFAKERVTSSHGASKLIGLPEYGDDKKKLENVLTLLNSPDKLREAMTSVESNGEFGTVFAQDAKDDVAIVSQEFSIEGLPSQKVAVVGPQRMDYKKVIGTLEYIATEIEKYFSVADDNKKQSTSKVDIPIQDAADYKKGA